MLSIAFKGLRFLVHAVHGSCLYAPLDEQGQWGLMLDADGNLVAGGRADAKFYEFCLDMSLGYPVLACVQEPGKEGHYGVVGVVYRSDGMLLVRDTKKLGGGTTIELVPSSVSKGEAVPGDKAPGYIIFDLKRLRGKNPDTGVEVSVQACALDVEAPPGQRWMLIREFLVESQDGRSLGALTKAALHDPVLGAFFAAAFVPVSSE